MIKNGSLVENVGGTRTLRYGYFGRGGIAMPTDKEPKSLGFSNDGLPSLLLVSGHFSSGKTEFEREVRAQLIAAGSPVRSVINYKGRDPRGIEVLGADYRRPESDGHYEELVQNGRIVVPYTHDKSKYGLSGEFVEALKDNKIPIMITDEGGLVKLIEYLETQKMPNKLISFMLHTNKKDALERLFTRLAREASDDEIRGVRSHLGVLDDEFERYKTHEHLFRHVFKNETVEGASKYERMNHLAARAMQILELEKEFDKKEVWDFREAFVDYAVGRLFGTKSAKDLEGSINQGVQLKIPDEVTKRYAQEKGINPSYLKKLTKQKIIASANHYGILSLYLEHDLNQKNKRLLVDLIEEAVGLNPQYKEISLQSKRESKFSLKQISDKDEGMMDFYISFSPYDPMRAPMLESRVHTLAFESLFYHKPVHIVPVSHEQAERFISGNGVH